MTSFLVLGDVMVDVTAILSEPMNEGSDTAARITLQPGGSAANTARWLAWAGQTTSLLGCIGDDPLGAVASSALIRDGVRPLLAVRPSSTTGTCIVLVGPTGERTMLPDAGANDLFDECDLPVAAFAGGDHLHVSGYILLRSKSRPAGLAAIRRARAAGMTVSLDASSAAPIKARPDAFDAVYPMLDLLLANADEAFALTGSGDPHGAAAALADRTPAVVVKLGSDGALCAQAGGTSCSPAIDTTVVDTTGAGDAFAAGLLASWTAGASLQQALESGNEVAARAVGRVGAGPPAD